MITAALCILIVVCMAACSALSGVAELTTHRRTSLHAACLALGSAVAAVVLLNVAMWINGL